MREKYLSSIRDLPMAAKPGQSSFKSRVAHGKAPEGEREFGILAPVDDEVEFILKAAPPTDLLRPRGPHCIKASC